MKCGGQSRCGDISTSGFWFTGYGEAAAMTTARLLHGEAFISSIITLTQLLILTSLSTG